MPLDRKYYIHCRGGALGQGDLTTLQDVDNIVSALKATASPRHLILHFHGGLVSREEGFGIAKTLLPIYQPGGYPLFYIWEAGAWEIIRNNITELADEPVFKQLLRKGLEYAFEAPRRQERRALHRAWHGRSRAREENCRGLHQQPESDRIPYKGFVPVMSKAAARSAADTVDADEIQADLEMDEDFKRALASLPDIPSGRRSALASGPPVPVRNTPFAQATSEWFSERAGQRGFITLWKAAMLIKDILVGLLRRYHAGRDHGLYATVVEEIIRAFKVGGSSVNEWAKALEWNRMKKDCDDAFQSDASRYAGTALLTRIRDALDGGKALKRVTLIGHSTGAVYISAWIQAAHALLAEGVRVDVVLLAPAITYTRFARTLTDYGSRIASFRMFAMSDELERNDQVWGSDPALQSWQDWRRFIYPSSLLYLVSGILESKVAANGALTDEPDMPLLGMQRYFASTQTYSGANFSDVDEVRTWLQEDPRRTVWSVANGGPGLASASNDHGYFDNEPDTLASLRHIVTSGF